LTRNQAASNIRASVDHRKVLRADSTIPR